MVILIVDDELGIRTALKEFLNLEGFCCLVASNAKEALDILQSNKNIKVVICDLRMPGITGLDLVRIYKKKQPEGFVKFIMITGFNDINTMRVSFKEGVIDYLNKPLDYQEVLSAVNNGIKQFEVAAAKQKTREHEYYRFLKASYQIKKKYLHIIELMLKMLEIKDEKLHEHSKRVYEISSMLASKMSLSVKEVAMIKIGAILHDIGKISIPHNLINKQLETTRDLEDVKKHSQNGYYLVKEYVEKNIAEIILHHHEHFNGQGYPLGLIGNAIPLGARVIAIANYYDYLRSKCYGLGLSLEEAIESLRKEEEKFDPKIFAQFLAMVKDIDEKIYKPQKNYLYIN